MNKKKRKINITIKRQRLELLRTIASEEGWPLEELHQISKRLEKSKEQSRKSG